MASPLSLEIQCPVCLCDFIDPVSLPCEHSFCRNCINGHVNASIGPVMCPQCRQPFSSTDIKESRLLRNIIESLKVHLNLNTSPGQAEPPRAPAPRPQGDLVCEEHDERLKLFCVTDQKLACTICKEQDKHQGHIFKPVKEAAEKNKGELKGALGFIMKENQSLHDLSQRQLAEIAKCEKSDGLKAQVFSQFVALHQFLRKKEKELLTELEQKKIRSVAAMQRKLSDIQWKAVDGGEKEVILRTALEIPRPDHFLQWWEDKGYPVTEGMKDKQETKFRSKVKSLVVTPDSMSMGPYESHLPLFVWKEMLQTIKPGPERLSMKDPGDSYLKLSPEGHSIRQVDRGVGMYKTYNPGTSTNQTFKTGRHYCELDVGGKQNWSVGLKVEMTTTLQLPEKEIQLHLKNGSYVFSHDGTETPVSNAPKDPPRRIGLYLDCDRQQVSFYNADTMSLIHSSFCSFLQPCSISVCPGLYLDGKNANPVTFCWY
ncbi:E3 ubiquitin-protein ligase TRIM62-like isoform X2 [Alosa pseudoharengus]|uniref:E3 ubiquitin-protein ligase TRIM62-like isoform X2 n=1 Tax=Alosa pseudoharengus TaxID=34774 RepID=UPI003F8BE5D0